MSYILDALKKSDHERAAKQASKPTIAIAQDVSKNINLMTVVMLIVPTLIVVWIVWWSFGTPEKKSLQFEHTAIKSSEKAHIKVPAKATIMNEDNRKSVTIAAVVPQTVQSKQIIQAIQRNNANESFSPREMKHVPQTEKDTSAQATMVTLAKTRIPVQAAIETKNKTAVLPVLRFSALPSDVRYALFDLHLEGHFYDDKKQTGMLVIHGQIYHAGDWVKDTLYLQSITEDGAMFEYQDKYRFLLSKLR